MAYGILSEKEDPKDNDLSTCIILTALCVITLFSIYFILSGLEAYIDNFVLFFFSQWGPSKFCRKEWGNSNIWIIFHIKQTCATKYEYTRILGHYGPSILALVEGWLPLVTSSLITLTSSVTELRLRKGALPGLLADRLTFVRTYRFNNINTYRQTDTMCK